MSTLSTTTPKALRSAFQTLIEAITPTSGDYSGEHWNAVEDEDPSGMDIRSFRILTDIDETDIEGVHEGEGYETILPMIIRTSYGGLRDNDLTDIVSQDRKDLWAAFHSAPGGIASSVTGLISVGFVSAELDGDPFGESDAVVDYLIEIHYKAAHT